MKQIKTEIVPTEITVDEILYRPRIGYSKIKILGENYHEIISSPKLYVVKTTHKFELDECVILTFEFEGNLITLEDVKIKFKNNMYFLECSSWKEKYK